jgi:hypothetical protein
MRARREVGYRCWRWLFGAGSSGAEPVSGLGARRASLSLPPSPSHRSACHRGAGLVERFAGCFTDSRAPELIDHQVVTLVGQRVFGIALGYEDLVAHDELRHDPTMAVLAGNSTLNRLERAARS